MKNKYLSYLFLMIFAGLWSCKTEDSVFEQTADERLSKSLAAYQKQLTDAPYGWKGVIYPGTGSNYGFYFKFNDQNRVVMYSDFDAESAAKPKESSYRVKAIETPSLIFDTYSYLHLLADPDGSVNGGVYGEGLKSDFEFSFRTDTVSSEEITLIGTKNQARLILTKATQEEALAYGNGGLAKSLLFNNISKYLTYFKRVTIGGVQYEISVNQNARTIKLTWFEGTTVKSFTTEYYYSSTGIVFLTPFVTGSQTISGFTNMTFNETTTQLAFTVGSSNISVLSAVKPLAADLEAPKRWWSAPQESGSYWRSATGFHVNGVDDAFGVKDLKWGNNPYYYYFYQPGVASTYDIFAPVFVVNNTLDLDYSYAAKTPTFTKDGRAVFVEYGTSSDSPVPTSGPAFETQKLIYDPSGYYFIQTSPTTYDMVSAKDAKSWISWF